MAYKKSVPSPSGAVAKYWRVSGVLIHENEKLLEIYLQGFLDEPTRRAVNDDGSPKYTQLCVGAHRLTAEQWKEMFGDASPDYPPKATLYAFLSTLPEWADAVEV